VAGKFLLVETPRVMSENSMYLRITTNPGELIEGLFGYILLHIFEVLPKLHDEGIL